MTNILTYINIQLHPNSIIKFNLTNLKKYDLDFKKSVEPSSVDRRRIKKLNPEQKNGQKENEVKENGREIIWEIKEAINLDKLDLQY